MSRSRCSFLLAVALMTVALCSRSERAEGQEVALTPMQTTEVARGYRAEAIKLKPVANEKNEVIGRVSDFVFSKDGNNIYVVLSVTDFSGPGSHLVAIPFRSLRLDDPSGYAILPGASAAALDRLPVFLPNH